MQATPTSAPALTATIESRNFSPLESRPSVSSAAHGILADAAANATVAPVMSAAYPRLSSWQERRQDRSDVAGSGDQYAGTTAADEALSVQSDEEDLATLTDFLDRQVLALKKASSGQERHWAADERAPLLPELDTAIRVAREPATASARDTWFQEHRAASSGRGKGSGRSRGQVAARLAATRAARNAAAWLTS